MTVKLVEVFESEADHVIILIIVAFFESQTLTLINISFHFVLLKPAKIVKYLAEIF